tara:strand:+ start:1985 stop:2089 length:105 start_codon:yes stop_codon:yes gene_type:complete
MWVVEIEFVNAMNTEMGTGVERPDTFVRNIPEPL